MLGLACCFLLFLSIMSHGATQHTAPDSMQNEILSEELLLSKVLCAFCRTDSLSYLMGHFARVEEKVGAFGDKVKIKDAQLRTFLFRRGSSESELSELAQMKLRWSPGKNILDISVNKALAGWDEGVIRAVHLLDAKSKTPQDLTRARFGLLEAQQAFFQLSEEFPAESSLAEGLQPAYIELVEALNNMLLGSDVCTNDDVILCSLNKTSQLVLDAKKLLLSEGVTATVVQHFIAEKVNPLSESLHRGLEKISSKLAL